MSLDDRLIVEQVGKTKQVKKWNGTWPTECQMCGVDLAKRNHFIDGKTSRGSWALMCPFCHIFYGVGLGTGKGQKYNSKTREKVEG